MIRARAADLASRLGPVSGLAILVAVSGAVVALCGYLVWGSALAPDEGYVLIAARELLAGRLPYRDFAYTQMPLAPWLGALTTLAAPYALVTHRILVALGALTALALIGWTLWRRHRAVEPVILALAALGLAPQWMGCMTLSRAWSLGTPFVTLAIAGIYLPGLSYSRRLALVAVGGALAAGTCLVAWPLVLLLIALLVATGRGPGQRAGAVLVPLGAALVALLPGIVAGPERFWDQAVGFHAASSFDRRGLPQVMEWWRQSPAGLSLLAVACCGLGLLRRGGRRLEPLALIGAGCAVVLPVLPAFAYGEWVAPLLPLVVLVAIDALWLGGAVRRLPFRHAAWLFVAVAWIYPFPEVAVTSPSTALPALARALDEEAGPGPILTPLSALAVEARRPVVAGTELGMFALGPADEEQRVRRLRLTTLPALSRALGQRRPAAVVLLDVASRWNFRWVMPSLTAQPEEDVQAFARALEAQYRPGRQEEGFVMLLPRDGDVGGATSRRAR